MSFRDSINLVIPVWLRRGVARKVLYTFAAHLDEMADELVLGIKSRAPGLGTLDSLAFIGRDRQIDRGPRETAQAYATRLSQAFDTWRNAGCTRTILGQLVTYFVPDVPLARHVSGRSLWHTLAAGVVTRLRASPANWDWDGVFDWWRAWVILYCEGGTPFDRCPPCGTPGFVCGEYSGTCGSTATQNDIKAIRRLLGKWKREGAYIDRIIIAFDATLFDPTAPPGDPSLPDGTWGDPGYAEIGGVEVSTRSPGAIYWKGVV